MQIKRALRTFLATAALTGAAFIAAPATQAHAQVFVSVGFAPPAIPVYEQPLCPGDGYIWTPGYWAWGPDGYYWVDGAWVEPPYEDALWTPGWWGFGGGAYFWHPGYWGRTVGYYGGINYGFGYFGTGFYGGYWNGGHFFYNRAYGHFGPGFHGNFYERREGGFDGHPGGASFVSHPPARFAAETHGSEAFHGSAINGTPRGTEAFANRNANGFANREQGVADRQQGFGDRGAVNNANRPAESFGGNQPNYNRGSQSFENRGNQNFENRAAPNSATQPSYNRGQTFENRGNQNFGQFNRGAQPSYDRAPAAPSGNFNRGGSAPAPHYSAPSGGGSRGGGGGGSHGGGGHR